MNGPPLTALLRTERERIDAVLETVAAGLDGPARIADPIGYAVRGGGKRLRPILCIAAYRAVRGDVPPAVYGLGAALELVHTYSLIHDDLPCMDDDPVRRGRPATHVAFGVPAATAAGAAMIPLAVGTALRAAIGLGLAREAQARVVQVLCAAAGAGGMVGGQVLDLAAEGSRLGLDELERIHRLKTGALLTAAPWLGGIAADAPGAVLDALRVYGATVGLAFQIADDILDLTGTTSVLGKTAGRDVELEKATFPSLAGLDEAERRARAEVTAGLAALEAAGVRSAELDALAHYAVERDR